MPRKPKRPCSYPACPELVDGRYCEAHQKLINKDYERYKRDPETTKRYGNAWRKLRKKFITANPLCEMCKREGRFIPAQEVHHMKPLSEGGTNDWSNLEALCKTCHARHHAKEGTRWS